MNVSAQASDRVRLPDRWAVTLRVAWLSTCGTVGSEHAETDALGRYAGGHDRRPPNRELCDLPEKEGETAIPQHLLGYRVSCLLGSLSTGGWGLGDGALLGCPAPRDTTRVSLTHMSQMSNR